MSLPPHPLNTQVTAVSRCCRRARLGTNVAGNVLLAFRVEDVDLKAEEMHVAFAVADGGPGVGLVRKPTKESDWHDVPLIDSGEGDLARQLARSREQTGREPRPGEYIFASDPEGTKPIRPGQHQRPARASLFDQHSHKPSSPSTMTPSMSQDPPKTVLVSIRTRDL